MEASRIKIKHMTKVIIIILMTIKVTMGTMTRIKIKINGKAIRDNLKDSHKIDKKLLRANKFLEV